MPDRIGRYAVERAARIASLQNKGRLRLITDGALGILLWDVEDLNL